MANNQYNGDVKDLHELPPILTFEDIQKIFRLKRAATYQLMRSPDFPSFKVGGAVRVYRNKLIEYIEQKHQKED
ncbi:helix-turn-helix domain-containing protein [Paenibacillus naphthalenovorans]|uniref:helix-turn-helix domain-containing protein n=1 Tax=Paenibacillus naphthalenovorans TaxID=162209 RepID=UPI003D297596